MSATQDDAATVMERLARVAERPVFRDLLGLVIDDAAPGRVDVHVDCRPELGHQPGWFQGTLVSAVAQVSCSFASASMVEGVSTSTIEQSVRFLAPARGERLVGRGRIVRAGRTISVSSSEVFIVRDGKEQLCAIMSATCRHSDSSGSPEE